MKYLLDTNICIELIRKKSPELWTAVVSHRARGLGISAITLAELEHGVMKSNDPKRNMRALAKFCGPLQILPFEGRAAGVYGRIRSQLERNGLPIGPMDMLIAAHAISVGAILVTNNTREFNRVQGLAVEDWSRPG